MNILDLKYLLDINRYSKIDINAQSPQQVYPDNNLMAPENNIRFLKECVRNIASINFVDFETGQIYAHLESGKLIWVEPELFNEAVSNIDNKVCFEILVSETLIEMEKIPKRSAWLDRTRINTLGRWGTST
ncbi:hypothetical protein ACFL17_04230 [Pseudomonadota bacterium]